MHILNSQHINTDTTNQAIDLSQTPKDVIFLSFADSDLLCFSSAMQSFANHMTANVASLSALKHPFSIDLYCQQTLQNSKFIIANILGGKNYWSYGVAQLSELAHTHNIALAFFPAQNIIDKDLKSLSNIDAILYDYIFQALNAGGVDNYQKLLSAVSQFIYQHKIIYHDITPIATADIYHQDDNPKIMVLFYRALILAGDTAPIDMLITTAKTKNIDIIAVYISGFKDNDSANLIKDICKKYHITIVLNLTGFAHFYFQHNQHIIPSDIPVIQLACGTMNKEDWQNSSQGMIPRDMIMNLALPEIDGRIFLDMISYKHASEKHPITDFMLLSHQPIPSHIERVINYCHAMDRLKHKPNKDKNLIIILANYPIKDSRIANGVGLDTPESLLLLLQHLKKHGYHVVMPDFINGSELIAYLRRGVTNMNPHGEKRVTLSYDKYMQFFQQLPPQIQKEVIARWGDIKNDIFFDNDYQHFALTITFCGNIAVAIQPARGYHIDPNETYHSPDLVPPHNYIAFYCWCTNYGDAIIHFGKHGNLEWLPGKSSGLSDLCYPKALMPILPHFYPFIVNDPGEGTQAKRRTHATIIDHMTPAMTRAENQGKLEELEYLTEEFALAKEHDIKRAKQLKTQISDLAYRYGFDEDYGFNKDNDTDMLNALDNYLCDIKEMQIRDGLHIFGQIATNDSLIDLLLALVRSGFEEYPSYLKILHDDLGGDKMIKPQLINPETEFITEKSIILQNILPNKAWRHYGHYIERLEHYAIAILTGKTQAPGKISVDFFRSVKEKLLPQLQLSADNEYQALLDGLSAKMIAPGPSGAPTRGRLDILPTGRNFYTLDMRHVPTKAAMTLGEESAQMIITHYMQEHGDYPQHIALTAWGTANMRTAGEDIAQCLALMGCRPQYDDTSPRVTGIEILPISLLNRPRIDVTLRISGFFRDAFPQLITLVNQAALAIATNDDDIAYNFLKKRYIKDYESYLATGDDEKTAQNKAANIIFGSKPGAYGAGLQSYIDDGGWQDDTTLAAAYISWGGYAYYDADKAEAAHDNFKERLARIDLTIQNQDNREHDILDSDDYYQFEGGLIAAIRSQKGSNPEAYHMDHANIDKLKLRTLSQEIGRVVYGRASNPKWIKSIKKHGVKGAFEIAATLDYLFAFAATSHMVKNAHFDSLFEAYITDDDTVKFLQDYNPDAYQDILNRFDEAITRNLWQPWRNDVQQQLRDRLKKS